MKQDVIDYAQGVSGQWVTKETVNHAEPISRVCRFDMFEDTSCAYEALGIDFVNYVTMENTVVKCPLKTGII